MIIVYYPCYNCIYRKLRYMCGYIDNTMSLVSLYLTSSLINRWLRFPINTILAWIINVYHEQGNIIITNLLLPLAHISNSLPLALESII